MGGAVFLDQPCPLHISRRAFPKTSALPQRDLVIPATATAERLRNFSTMLARMIGKPVITNGHRLALNRPGWLR